MDKDTKERGGTTLMEETLNTLPGLPSCTSR